MARNEDGPNAMQMQQVAPVVAIHFNVLQTLLQNRKSIFYPIAIRLNVYRDQVVERRRWFYKEHKSRSPRKDAPRRDA